MILFCDGFDTYTDLSQKWNTVTGSPTISPTAARNGTNGALFNASGQTIRKSVPSTATAIMSFAIKTAILGNGPTTILRTFDGVGNDFQVTISLDAAGTLNAYRGDPGSEGSNLLGSASGTFTANAWHYIECLVTIHPSAGVFTIKMDGVTVLNLTSQNTSRTGNSSFTAFDIGWTNFNWTSIYYDDVVYLDTSGSVNNTFLGDVTVSGKLPSANGTANQYTAAFGAWSSGLTVAVGKTIKDSNNNIQRVTTPGTTGAGSHPTWSTTGGGTTNDNGVVWTCIGAGSNPGSANWMAVSEPVPDDDSSYVTDNVSGDLERYTYPAISGASAVLAVVVNARAEKTDTGLARIRAATKSGSATSDSGTDIALTQSSYVDYQGIFETDPNTSTAWTQTTANAAEFGIKTV